MSRCMKVRNLPGRVPATDEEILVAYRDQKMFLNQIRSKYIIGMPRLRKIVRAYEATALPARA